MTWPLAKIDTINQALTLTGNTVCAANDGTDEWTVGSAAYESAIEDLFDRYDWPGLFKIASVASAGPAPDATFTDAFAKPSDLVHLVWVRSGGAAIQYTVLTNFILANTVSHAAISIKYVASTSTPETASLARGFESALLARVMSGIYRGLNEEPDLADKMLATAESIIARAIERVQQETQAQPRITTYPLDRLTIVNDALVMAGLPMRSQIDDGSTEWNTGAVAYQAALERMLDAADWDFALTEQSVARVGNPADPSWDDAYTKPADMLHLIWVRLNNAAIGYALFGGQIFASAGAANIQVKYIKQPTVDQVSPLFVASLRSYVLSAVLRAVVKDAKEADAQWQIAEGYLKEAIGRSADETLAQPRTTSWPLDKLTIINDALRLSGNRPRAQIDDGSREWGVCSSAYESALLRLMEAHNWPFSTHVATLTRSGTPADQDFNDAYNKPSDLLHLIWVKVADQPVVYQVLDNQIVLSAFSSPVTIKYVRQPSVTLLPPTFVDALRTYVLSACFQALDKPNAGEAAHMWNRAEKWLAEAKAKVDQEQPKRAMLLSRLSARRQVRGPWPRTPFNPGAFS